MEQLHPYYEDKQKRTMKDLEVFWFVVKIMFYILLIAFAAKGAFSQPTNKELERLLDAIAKIESDNNDLAVGDSGKAIGRYQIHKAYWLDGCKYLKVSWPYKDAVDPVKARQIVRAYLLHYTTVKRLGRQVTLEDFARNHNGGPNGYKKSSTKKYWIKIKKVL